MLAAISAWILKRFGWSIQVCIPDLKKFIVIAAPHTSNWDFFWGILVVWLLKLKVTWMGKHSLFYWPLGWFFRAIGGTPVHRNSSKNYIAQMSELFEKSESLILALAPEGTRSKTDHWKTGFYYIARAAGVPILMGCFDYENRRLIIGDLLYPTEDIEADFEKIRRVYQDKRGKNPQNTSLIRVRPKTRVDD
jgi:1-acyl-sn-glycerol-3-phosphate acyltransferase